jgi:2-keto-3-deoxy-L-rhamnonate aldolase RhmA
MILTGPAGGRTCRSVAGRWPGVEVLARYKVRLAVRKHGKACGLLVPDGAAAAAKMAEGWTFVTIGSDSTLLATAASAQIAQARTRG